MKSPTIHSYSAAYEQAKRDVDIEEEKAARLRAEQLEGLKKREKKDQRVTDHFHIHPLRDSLNFSLVKSSPFSFLSPVNEGKQASSIGNLSIILK